MAEATKPEFWRWTESNWRNPDLDWRTAKWVAVGIDVGSVSSQAVLMADGQMLGYGNMRTGSDSPNSARHALKFALEAVDMPEDRMNYCIGTGYGRVNVPFAQRTITEITCHARGANFLYGPDVRTVLDVGGQDIKCIQCDENGKVTNFLMNDKCAAGTGRGMEVFADLLGVPITDVGARSFEFKGEEPAAVSSTCVVYAKSEAIALLRKGWTREEVLAAYCKAMADRIFALVERVVHGSENAAAAVGIPIAAYKTRTFVLAAVLAALGGVLATHYNGGIGPSEASVMKSVRYVAIVAVGGMANLRGAVVIGTILTFLSLRGYFGTLDDLVFGGILLAMMLFAPEGVVGPGIWRGARAALARLRRGGHGTAP